MPFRPGVSGNPRGTFKPGQSGNPRGRAKGVPSLTAALRRRLAAHPEEVDGILDALIREALAGSIAHIREILDRVEGKAPDRPDWSEDELIDHEVAAAMLRAGLDAHERTGGPDPIPGRRADPWE